MNKINELACTVSDMEPDLVLVTESWCSGDIMNAFLNMAGYELQPDLRVDRTDTDCGRGGGLLVYVKNGLQILSCDKVADFQQYCKFIVRDVVFYLIYRSPNSAATEVTKLAELIKTVEKNAVILGDFNLPQIDWTVDKGSGRESWWRSLGCSGGVPHGPASGLQHSGERKHS